MNYHIEARERERERENEISRTPNLLNLSEALVLEQLHERVAIATANHEHSAFVENGLKMAYIVREHETRLAR